MKIKQLTNGEISEFCKSLGLLLHAGIGPGDGLFLMAEEERGEKKTKLEEMGRAADMGFALSHSMMESGWFPAYVTSMVNVGEATGQLEEALDGLAGYYENQDRMNRQIKSALAYPSMLMCMMAAVIGVLMVKVLPVFDDVYGALGGSLTGIAGGLLTAGQMLKSALPLIGILLAAVAAGIFVFAKNEHVRNAVVGWWQKRYGDRGVSRKINDARFAQALAMGLKSGLPLEDAVQLAGDVLAEVPEAKKRCESCRNRLMSGESLSGALKRSEILPASACRMLELGIRSGNGDAVMAQIADRLSEDAAEALERRVAQIEPAMVMTASILVGFILLAVMLPLMHIMSAIG